MPPKVVEFHYFGLYARGEPLRMALACAGVWKDIKETRMEFSDWPAAKANKELYPSGCMPIIKMDNGCVIDETMNVLRFIGCLHGFYP